jgi:hypothetical protein
MKSKHTGILLIAALMVVLVATLSLAGRPQPSLAQEDAGTQALPAPAGLVAGELSYQGRLLDSDGNPVDGTRTMTFRLYSQAAGGDPLWSQTHNSIPVESGYFSVALDVDAGLFDGQELWLGVQVEGDPLELEPRQPMLPAPYALSLRPGASVRGALDEPVIQAENHGLGVGIVGRSTGGHGVEGTSIDAAGVYGQSVNTAGFFTSTLSYGVHANTFSEDPEVAAVLGDNHGMGHGVVGLSLDGFAVAGFGENNFGVYGESKGSPAGFFTSTLGIGVHANTSSDDPEVAAVLGENHGWGHGVVGLSLEGSGVAGYSQYGYAVYGQGYLGSGVTGESELSPGVSGHSEWNYGGAFSSQNENGIWASSLSSNPGIAAIMGQNDGSGIGVLGVSIAAEGGYFSSDSGTGVAASSVNGPAAVFASDNGPGIVVGSAGAEGLRIMDTVALDYIVAGSDEDFDFKVSNVGDVFADGSYHCGEGPGSEPGTCIIQNDPADFAEMLPADAGLEPGDVLVIGPDGRLARSTQAYQPTVVGAYSTQPGYLGGGQFQGQDGYAPLAISGIVTVKVSAENGPIRPGDLLVASGTPGYAMRAGANPPQGTVIGKALAPLERGTGIIQMLAMLQ